MLKPLVNDAQIERVVHTFYAEVRADPLIGPTFNAAVTDWDEHLDRLTDFWSSIMNTSGRYKGSPMQKHLALHRELTPDRFVRWLEIWHETTERLCDPDTAAAFQQRAGRIAESLQLGLAISLARETGIKEKFHAC